MKICIECKRELPKTSFHKDKTNKDRLRTRCKNCRSKLAKIYWKINSKKKTALRRKEYSTYKKGILEKFGNKCVRCGFNDWRALQVDHINGGGSRSRVQKSRNWYSFYKEVLKDEKKQYQLLCANCNWIKRYEKSEGNFRIRDE